MSGFLPPVQAAIPRHPYPSMKINLTWPRLFFSLFIIAVLAQSLSSLDLLEGGGYTAGVPTGSDGSILLTDYVREIPKDIAVGYTQCEAEYDCNSSIILQAVQEVDNLCGKDASVKQWVNCAVKYLNIQIEYDRGGGNAQCGELASEVLKSGQGNCVDYATTFVAFARAKKLPAYTGSVCLTSSGSVGCELYQTIRPLSMTRLGGMSFTPRGHAIAMIYLNKSWIMVDPTFEYGLTRKCWGYSPVLEEGVHEQVCKLPLIKALPYM